MSEQEKKTIKETLEMGQLVLNTLNRAKAAMAGDGKISAAEGLAIAMAEVPDAIRAFAGASEIVAEMKDLDDSEKTAIAELGLQIVKASVAIFKPEISEQLKGD